MKFLGIQDKINETDIIVTAAERDYNKGKPKKWVVCVILAIIGA